MAIATERRNEVSVSVTIGGREISFETGKLEWITFTSPSTFKNLLQLLGPTREGALRR